MRSFLCVVAAGLLGGCAVRPLVINWPNVVVETNLPLSRQGVVLVNGVVDSPRVYLDISKTGYYGTSVLVHNLPPGGSFFVPADGGWLNNQTMTVVVTGYVILGQDSLRTIRLLVGTLAREFSFYNSGGYFSHIEPWRIGRYDLQRY